MKARNPGTYSTCIKPARRCSHRKTSYTFFRRFNNNSSLRKVAEAVAGAAGVDFWRVEEPTLAYIVGLLALQVVAREVFKRFGPFKEDAAIFAHQARGRGRWWCDVLTRSLRNAWLFVSRYTMRKSTFFLAQFWLHVVL